MPASRKALSKKKKAPARSRTKMTTPSAAKRAAPARAGRHPYSVHPSVAMVEAWVASLKEKTGRSLAEWMKEINANGPADEVARRDWLKKNHRLGTNSAWWLAERSLGKGSEEDTPEGYLRIAPKYVETMFTGAKSALRPIYDRLLAIGLKLGKDVKACPCQTMVPLYRTNVFANLKPTTNTRLDLGLFLRGQKTPARVISTGGEAKGDRITHRIGLSSVDEIDAEVERWLRAAYELAGDDGRVASSVKLR